MIFSQLKALSQPPLPPPWRKNISHHMSVHFHLYLKSTCTVEDMLLSLSTCVENWWGESPGQTLKSGQILNDNEAWVHDLNLHSDRTRKGFSLACQSWTTIPLQKRNRKRHRMHRFQVDGSLGSCCGLHCFADAQFEMAKNDSKHKKHVRCDLS